nr:MAG: hypothetical protein [uncultured archaeon]
MRRVYWLLLGFVIGIIGFWFIPPTFKIFSFLIPLIILCRCLTSENSSFNINLFCVISFIFVLIPTDLFTFSMVPGNGGGGASVPVIVDTPLGTNFEFYYTIESVINILVIIIFIVIPIILLVGSIYAIIIGQVNNAVKGLVKLFIVIFFVMIVAIIFNFVGLDMFGAMGIILDIYVGIAKFLASLPVLLYSWLDGIEGFFNLDNLPALPNELYAFAGVTPPSGEVLTNPMDSIFLQDALVGMSYHEILFAIHDSFPFIIASMCLVSAIFYSNRSWENHIEDVLTKYEKKELEPKKPRKYFPGLNYKLIFYGVLILGFAFAIFLSDANAYSQFTNEDLTGTILYDMFKTVGFFSIYVIISIFSILVLNYGRGVHYKDATFKNTCKGIVYGLTGLFFFFHFFTSAKTMDTMSYSNIPSDIAYVTNQFIFVAPTESLFFHVLIPALVSGAILYYTGRKLKKTSVLDIETELNKINAQISMQKNRIDFYRSSNKKQLSYETNLLNHLLKKKRSLELKTIKVSVQEKTLFGRLTNVVLLVIGGIIVPNIFFSLFHMFASNMDIYNYVLSGLFFIFLVAGCWFSYISLRYGWLSCILSHALWNTLNVILILVFAGVI